MKTLYYIVKYIRLAGKFIGLPLFIVFMYLSFTGKWDAYVEETSIIVLSVLIPFTFLSFAMYLRGENYEYKLKRKHWKSTRRIHSQQLKKKFNKESNIRHGDN